MSNHLNADRPQRHTYVVRFNNRIERAEIAKCASLFADRYDSRAAFWGAMLLRGCQAELASRGQEAGESDYDV